MKKILCVLLVTLMMLSLVSCGKKGQPEVVSQTDEVAAPETTSSEDAASVQPATVSVTVPEVFLEFFMDGKDVSMAAEMGFISAETNSDSSVTFVMTPEKHDELVKTIYDEIVLAVKEMNGLDDSYNLTVEASEDMSEFKVYLNDTMDFTAVFAVYSLSMYGQYYNIMSGRGDVMTTVNIYNANGELTNSVNYQTAEALVNNLFTGADEYSYITFEESTLTDVVLVDNEDFTFVVNSIEANGTWGYTLNVSIQNKTSSHISFYLDKERIDRWMCESLWSEDVEAGQTADSQISFMKADLARAEIIDPSCICFELTVSDYDDYFAEPLYKAEQVIYPKGDNTEVVVEREKQSSDLLILSNEVCDLYCTNYDPSGIYGFIFDLYIYNKSDKTLSFGWENPGVNGWDVDSYFAAKVCPGCRTIERVVLSDDSLEKYGIYDITSLDFDLYAYDVDGDLWETTYLIKDDHHTIYPNGKENAVVTDLIEKTDDVVLVSTADYDVVYRGFSVDYFGSANIMVYIDNKTDHKICVGLKDIFADGVPQETDSYFTVSPHRRAIKEFYMTTVMADDNGELSVGLLQFRLRVSGSDYIEENVVFDDSFEIVPNL